METVDIGRIIFSFIGVVVLIFIVAMIAKRLGLHTRLAGLQSPEKRLQIIDAMPIDARRRLIIVRRDTREHLILIGMQEDLLIESYESEEKNHA